MADTSRKPSEHDPFPGVPTSQADRDALARRDAARKAGAPVPPLARPYNGYDRRA